MAALLAWGIYLAVGTFLNHGNLPTLRGLIVLACTVAFLGLWGLLMLSRNRRLKNEAAKKNRT